MQVVFLVPILLDIHAIERRMLIDDLEPSINADDRYYSAALGRKGEYLTSERIQSVLVADRQECRHLGIGSRFSLVGKDRLLECVQEGRHFHAESTGHS